MKRLFIIRHSKAVARRAGLPDFERPLVKKGVKSANNLADRLKKAGIKPDLFVSSPANRALETAHVFAKEFGYHVQKIQLKDMLYEEATQGALLALVHSLDNARQTVFLFGHNPALQDFGQFLIKDFPGRLPKMGVVGLEFSRNSWKAVGPGAGKLIFFDFPGREAQDERQKSEDLAVQLARAIETTLERVDPAALENVRPDVEGASRKIAGRFLAGLKGQPEKTVEKKKADPKKPKGKPASKEAAPKKPKARKPDLKPPAAAPKPDEKPPEPADPHKPIQGEPTVESKDQDMPKVSAFEAVLKSFPPMLTPEGPPAPTQFPDEKPPAPADPHRLVYVKPALERKEEGMPEVPAPEAVPEFFPPKLTPERSVVPRFGDDEPKD